MANVRRQPFGVDQLAWDVTCRHSSDSAIHRMPDADNPDCSIPRQGPEHDTVAAVNGSDDNHKSGAAPMSRTLSRLRIGTLITIAVLSVGRTLVAQDVTYDF